MSFAFLSKELESSFVPVILCRDIRLLLVVLYRDSNLSPSELYLVRVLLLLSFLLLRLLVDLNLVSVLFGHCFGQVVCVCCLNVGTLLVFGGFLRGFSDCFGLGFVYFLGYLCFTHCASLYVDSVFVVRDGCKKDCFVFPG